MYSTIITYEAETPVVEAVEKRMTTAAGLDMAYLSPMRVVAQYSKHTVRRKP